MRSPSVPSQPVPLPRKPEMMITEAVSEHVIASSGKLNNCEGFVSLSSENTMKLMHIFATLPEGRVHGGRLMEMLSTYPYTGEPSNARELMMTTTAERSTAYDVMVHEWI